MIISADTAIIAKMDRGSLPFILLSHHDLADRVIAKSIMVLSFRCRINSRSDRNDISVLNRYALADHRCNIISAVDDGEHQSHVA
jgi:hypothetical protein